MKKYNVKNGKLIRKYGEDVLRSEEFRKGKKQIHHKYTTVANHTLYVTDMALQFSKCMKVVPFLKINDKVLVQAGLCHDLGIIGRDKKFHNNMECYKCHSGESVPITKRIYPDVDVKTLDAIACHMFPLTPIPPKSPEGFLLIAADKYCSVAERVYLELRKGKRANRE